MKAIMYHYIRQFDNKHPNFRFLILLNFRTIRFFEQNFGFVDKDEWNQFINEGKAPSRKGMITHV